VSISVQGSIQKSMQNILQEVLADPFATRISCEQIDLENFLVYIEAELAGHDAANLHPWVRAALDGSLACRQEYEEIKEFLLLEHSDGWRVPTRAPRLDFSYLPVLEPAFTQQPAPSYQPMWYWEQLNRLVIQFSAELLQRLQALTPQPAYTFERSNQSGDGSYQFALDETLEDLNVQINIQRVRQANDHYQIVVETNIPSRGGWPHLANTIVNLKHADAVVQSRLTDAFGKAVFNDIAATLLAQLQVEIIPGPPEGQPEPGRQSG
jgi:hypothetical protein